MEYYGVNINENLVKVGGQQHLATNDGYIFPINTRRGLPYLDMRPYTDQENGRSFCMSSLLTRPIGILASWTMSYPASKIGMTASFDTTALPPV